MFRVATNVAARTIARRAPLPPSSASPVSLFGRVSASAAHLCSHGLSSLAPTAPIAIRASNTILEASQPSKTPAVSGPSGKISQVIGAVVDVHFGKSAAANIVR